MLGMVKRSAGNWWPPDIREEIFRGHMERTICAAITVQAAGVLSGMEGAQVIAENMQLSFSTAFCDGDRLSPGCQLARVAGNPFQIAKAENVLLGALSKSSGIATAARRARDKAGSGLRVVSGGFKKMPHVLKAMVRKAVRDGGLEVRMVEHPFVYLDKNYVRILGGIEPALQAVSHLGGNVVIQVRGETAPIGQEAVQAALAGAALVMVDTGRPEDLARVSATLREKGLRAAVQVAFAGEVDLEQLEELARYDVDAVDIGYAIVDAPCLPMRFDVLPES